MNDFENYIVSCFGTSFLTIYGTGLAAQTVYESLKSLGIQVKCFCESGTENGKKEYLGLPVKTQAEIPSNSRCLICANPEYGIEKRLENYGIFDWRYIDPEILKLYASDKNYFSRVRKMIDDNEAKIKRVRKSLADEKSKDVLDTILSHRCDPDIKKTYEMCTEQYFGNDLIHEIEEYDFVDCGAYNGDTLRRFVGQLNDPKEYFKNHTYHAFEADANNVMEIEHYCKEHGYEHVKIHQAAVWNGQQKELFFETDDNEIAVGGKAGVESNMENAIKIKAESLDDALAGENVDMVIMDIEGAEPEALKGAKQIIKQQAPVLAISVYHKLEHLWEIPLQIQALNENYKLYLRHHRWNMHDTVCYAINRE
jgi:FkbM family methyltransferase